MELLGHKTPAGADEAVVEGVQAETKAPERESETWDEAKKLAYRAAREAQSSEGTEVTEDGLSRTAKNKQAKKDVAAILADENLLAASTMQQLDVLVRTMLFPSHFNSIVSGAP
jgi:hypothetical protein